MSESNETTRELDSWGLDELAQLGAADPRRAEFDRRLAQLSPSERDQWLAVAAEMEQIRQKAGGLEMPLELMTKLLAIADTPVAAPADAQPNSPSAPAERFSLKSLLSRRGGRLAVAACLLVGLGILAYMMQPEKPAWEKPLDGRIVAQLTSLAEKYQPPGENGAQLEYSSSDAEQVRAAMAKHALPFTPAVLKTATHVRLLGEGVCTFDKTPAVFTRWQDDIASAGKAAFYTLYQFDGKPFGIPTEFKTTQGTPKAEARRVEIWASPDGQCTWVLVADNAPQTNPFHKDGY